MSEIRHVLDAEALLRLLARVHDETASAVTAATRGGHVGSLSGLVGASFSDHAFALDRVGEAVFYPLLEQELSARGRFVVIGEGAGENDMRTYPRDLDPDDADWTIIADPIDGTRGLMFDKRSAWVLSAATRTPLSRARLEDMEIALQTELPTTRAAVADQLRAVRGEGCRAVVRDVVTGLERPYRPRPSEAATLAGGFSTFVRFFPPARDLTAALDDRFLARVLGAERATQALVFEDQYVSTAGLLWQLATGRDRFTVDVRHLLAHHLTGQGLPGGHPCHPHDLCTFLVAREAGVAVTGITGEELDFGLGGRTACGFAAWANPTLRRESEDVLLEVLREGGLV